MEKSLLKFVSVVIFMTLSLQGCSGHDVRASRHRYRPRRAPLSVYYYSKTCPQIESIVYTTVQQFLLSDPTLAASLIRLFFHDCFVRGCDGSVLLDSAPLQPAEKLGAPNAGSIRGFELIEAVKVALEAQCPNTVSCADIVALASRDATVFSGGPYWKFPLGRRDGFTSLASDTLINLPAPFFNFSSLVQSFASKGLNVQDLITLSGAHTVGRAHCAAIVVRLYNFDGFGNPDPTLDPAYVTILKNACPVNAPGNFIPMDPNSSLKFDSSYYNDVLTHRGLFQSDAALINGSRLATNLVRADTRTNFFFYEFPAAMIKMGNIGVLTGKNGEIRKICNQTNAVTNSS